VTRISVDCARNQVTFEQCKEMVHPPAERLKASE
jgi:hypothetical protein